MPNYFDLINAQLNGTNNSVNSPITALPFEDSGESVTHVESTYNMYELSIVIKDGTKISLLEVYTSVEIFEDIFSNSIHGYIEIDDSYGGLEKFAFSGGELLTITMLKPNPSTETILSRNDLVVHQISKVETQNENMVRYKLFFVPFTTIFSQKKRIYRAYRNERRIAELISKIYQEIGTLDNLGVYAEDISLTKNFLCPGYTPFEAITFLSKRACASEEYHLFFERVNKMAGKTHIYGNINKINRYWFSGTIPTITHNAYQNYATNENNENIRAIKIEYQNNFNHISNMMSGFYNSNVRLIDPIRRKYSDNPINYNTLYRYAYNNIFLKENNIFMTYNNSYPEYPGERMSVVAQNDPQSNKFGWISNDTYGAIDMSMIRVNIEISGGSNMIGVGNLIDLKIPSLVSRTMNLGASAVEDDSIYSGWYTVTAVRHMISRTSYIKKMEVSKSPGGFASAF